MADRKAANRLSAEISRDEKRQRLGVAEFNRQRAEEMRKHRKKKREEAEMAQAQAELQAEAAPQTQAQAEQAQAQTAQARAQAQQLEAEIANKRQKLQELEQQTAEAQAKFDAANAAAAAEPPLPPSPSPSPQEAPSPAAEPKSDTAAPIAFEPLPTEIIPLSDALKVSSAPNLNAADVLKLVKLIDAGDMAHVDGALRRLQVVTLTPELQRSTAVDQTVMALKRHDNPDVRALSETISSAWATQVDLELKRRAAVSKRGRKFTGTGAAGCMACQGKHRPHTCNRA